MIVNNSTSSPALNYAQTAYRKLRDMDFCLGLRATTGPLSLALSMERCKAEGVLMPAVRLFSLSPVAANHALLANAEHG
jgi:hypothetical protein